MTSYHYYSNAIIQTIYMYNIYIFFFAYRTVPKSEACIIYCEWKRMKIAINSTE